MTVLWTGDEIAAATGGTASARFDVTGVTFDSREVGPGDLFVAMPGTVHDGHDFLDAAFAAGAAAAITSRVIEQPHVLVDDVFAALQALGRASRERTNATVIGVTGSVGKTSTKEALYAALDRCRPGKAHRSVKSYNNHTGVPLSLARMPRDTDYAVFEMGMNNAGEITELTRQVRPHVAIITAIAPAHIESLGSEEAIADAKGEIFQGLEPGGTAIVPFDSPHRERLIAAAKPHAARILTFGLGEGADVRALEAVPALRGGTLVNARLPGAELSFTIAAPGEHWVSNALAVIAAVEAAGGDLAAAGLALADLEGLPGRGRRIEANGALIIDEAYNANPASMAATLKLLGEEKAERRIVVLGEMRELGEHSARYHAALADPIVAANVEYALLVGSEMAPLANALEGKVNFEHVPDAATALARLQRTIAPGDAVLIKGSNAIGLARVVDALATESVECSI